MKNCPSMSAPTPQPHWKTSLVMAIALFVITLSLLACAPSSELIAGASRYPAITIYVGSG